MHNLLRNERGGIVRWIIIIIVVGAAFYGYQHFKKTPRYTLIQFKKAIMLSDVDAAERYMNLERVARSLPESITGNAADEIVMSRLRSELDSPTNKGFFKRVRDWRVFTVPIDISENQRDASAQPGIAANVRLEKTNQETWIITAIQIDEAQDPDIQAAQKRKELSN